ncbi:Qat anti-phage system QueC-like protein QatC [Noviherbaspirillum malthae]|uniref:Qat anti-phage system QueC-like protein QatC n=1 Tax=Noviherbaspirillum malthae TaxID=1260987 RepID=UPI001E598E4F|nr:Qat anti-phage system QueC-like protein QatC [Noviherbaspirillum malthae]
MYAHDGLADVSTVGTSLVHDIKSAGISPSAASWDFLTLALAVNAADHAVERNASSDGWTRTIDLEVALYEPDPFRQLVVEIQQALRFLTGDFWRLTLIEGGYPPPRPRQRTVHDADCVSLLSGGLDSLIGALDLTAQGRAPIFVSHIAKGDSETQRWYAQRLGGAERHLQWNQNIWLKPQRDGEGSTRGRSIVFFAFAALAADNLSSTTTGAPVDVFVPENGLISLNVPLNAGRVGSLSTKTTHPVFMQRLQALWTALDIPAVLRLPYAALTKGEMMAACLDQASLTNFAGQSTSCGRYSVFGLKHCGRCVPCLVRRSAFLRAGMTDTTATYVFPDLSAARPERGPNDVAAVAAAVLKVEQSGIRAMTAGQFAFAAPARRAEFEGVVERGLSELGALLRLHNVL